MAHRRRTCRRLAAFAAVVLGAVSGAAPVPAQSRDAAKALVLPMDAGELVRVPGRAQDVYVANPEIANIQVPTNTRIFVNGKTPGQTTLMVLNARGEVLVDRTIRVTPPLNRVERRLAERYPDARVGLSSSPGRIVLNGQVRTPVQAREVAKTVRGALPEESELVNRLTVTGPTQVSLKVRIAEVRRSVQRQLGFNLQSIFDPGELEMMAFTGREFLAGTGGGPGGVLLSQPGTFFQRSGSAFGSAGAGADFDNLDFTFALDALADDGMVKTLAQPNLSAQSGETASFLAGGETPIPVASDDGEIDTEFKKFGIALSFTPTILSEDRISMRVRPEVSEIDPTASITLQGLRIPGFRVRRAETTMELGSGQSFAIGGLFQNDIQDSVERFPFLSELPVVGRLFSSTQFQNDQSELVIVVTPYIVEPTATGEARQPFASLSPNVRVEDMLRSSPAAAEGAADALADSPDGQRLYGTAGHAL